MVYRHLDSCFKQSKTAFSLHYVPDDTIRKDSLTWTEKLILCFFHFVTVVRFKKMSFDSVSSVFDSV